jgi:hypothetical protein
MASKQLQKKAEKLEKEVANIKLDIKYLKSIIHSIHIAKSKKEEEIELARLDKILND